MVRVGLLRRLAAALTISGVLACGGAAEAGAPQRVVSMNLCTDQLAMLIAAPGQLHSVSQMAADPRSSVLADRAEDYVINHGRAEEIFLMQPDLVIAGAYTTRAAVEMLRRLGFRVAELGLAASFDDVRGNIRRMGELLGRKARAEALVAALDARLAELRPKDAARPEAALYYPNGFSSGAGTLADEILEAAGLSNIAAKLGLSGLARLPLEALVMAEPDLLVTDRPGEAPALAQQAMTHPALRPLAGRVGAALRTDGRWTCGAPFTAEAVAALAEVRVALPKAPEG